MPVMAASSEQEHSHAVPTGRLDMNRQLKNAIQAARVLLLGLGMAGASAAQADFECSPTAIQAISPTNTTIVSAVPQSDPVAYSAVVGYVTTKHPGPNQVNFGLSLPAKGNGRFLFIGNGGFAGDFNIPEVFPD